MAEDEMDPMEIGSEVELGDDDDVLFVDEIVRNGVGPGGDGNHCPDKAEKAPPAAEHHEAHIDHDGNRWDPLPGISAAYFLHHYPLLGLEQLYESKQSSVLICSERYDREKKCPYMMLLLKGNDRVYQRNTHTHDVARKPEDIIKKKKRETDPLPDAELADKMECEGWKLLTIGIWDEDKWKELRESHQMMGVAHRRHNQQDVFDYYVCNVPNCSYRMRWLRRRGQVYTQHEHSRHPIKRGRKSKRGKKAALKRLRTDEAEDENASNKGDHRLGLAISLPLSCASSERTDKENVRPAAAEGDGMEE